MHDQIYTDYLVARLLNTPLSDILKKYDICKRTLFNIVNKYEHPRKLSGSNFRSQLWKYKYSYIHTEEHAREAMIREMYYVSGFPVKEIVEYTGKGKAYVLDVLCG